MATTTETKQDVNPDVMPDVDDDVIETESREAASDGADAPVVEARRSETPKRYDPREEAVRMYRERRAQQEAAERADSESENEPEDDQEIAAEPAVKAEVPPVHASPADNAEPEFEIKVNGKSQKLSARELIAKAQIALASEEILAEAKAIREDARALRGRSTTEQHQPVDADNLNGYDARPDASGKAEADQPVIALDAERLEEIVQGIQVGDVEEGKKALEQLVSLMAASAASKTQDVRPVVEEAIARRHLQDEIERAGNSFRDKYGNIVENQEMFALSFSRLSNEIRSDLSRAGVDPETTKSLDLDGLINQHMQVRSRGGKGLRSYDTMMDKVGSDMMSTYGSVLGRSDPTPARSPQPSPSQASERLERKRQAAPQPLTAGVRTQPSQPAKPKSREEVIAEMRRARGFSD